MRGRVSEGLRKIQEVQQMFSIKGRWKPQELHLLFFPNISLFVRMFFSLKWFSAKTYKTECWPKH